MLSGKGEDDIRWITVKGSHIPLKEGENPKEAIKEFFDNKIEKQDAVKHLVETLKKIRKIKNSELIDYIRNLKPVKLQINDREIIAQFDIHTARENIFGDKISDLDGYKYKINNIEKLPGYIETSQYSYSSPEKGKKSKSHKNVKEWHYFINQIQTDKGDYNINVNVRDKGSNQFVYLVTFNRNKKT